MLHQLFDDGAIVEDGGEVVVKVTVVVLSVAVVVSDRGCGCCIRC